MQMADNTEPGDISPQVPNPAQDEQSKAYMKCFNEAVLERTPVGDKGVLLKLDMEKIQKCNDIKKPKTE